MTKNDYELIARSFATELDRKDIDQFKASSMITWILANLCRELETDNPAFDKGKFIKATGLFRHVHLVP